MADVQSACRRVRSSPPSLTDAATELGPASGDEDDSDDGAPVLFDACRFQCPTEDLLDCVLGDEPWQDATEASNGRSLKVVGDVGALKLLFSLPLRSAGEAVCIHRIGDCLIVLDANSEQVSEGELGENSSAEAAKRMRRAAACATASASTYSPRASAMRCQVNVEGDMVRVYPRIDHAEPVDVASPSPATEPIAACCEWRVREGLSLLALTPRVESTGEAPGLVDLRSMPPRLMAKEAWLHADSEELGGLGSLDVQGVRWPSPPACHRRVSGDRAAVRAVRIPDSLDTTMLADAWLSCCLLGSPSLLCFFVDGQGICRGCRFVLAADIPMLDHIAKAYHPNQRCLANDASPSAVGNSSTSEIDRSSFDPKALRHMSHSLLDTLIDRCDHDGKRCLVVASPLGINVLNASLVTGEESDKDLDEDCGEKSGQLMLELPTMELLAGFERQRTPPTSPTQKEEGAVSKELQATPAPQAVVAPQEVRDRVRRAHTTQALLLYHAAVRLAQPRLPQGSTVGGVKGVPIGSRWTAKSCRHPLRVRQMMLRAINALRAAMAVGCQAGATENTEKPSGPQNTSMALSKRRFLLLLASACEFLADTFLAEDSPSSEALEAVRQLSALRHLQKSTAHLTEYMNCRNASSGNEDFTQSVKRLEERVFAKRANAHLCLARLRQRQPWGDGEDTSRRAIGEAYKELDAAEALVAQPPRVAQQSRPLGAHECSLLASISKWKADLLFELVAISAPGAVPGADVDPRLKEYLEAQQRDLHESLQPLPLQRERWLQAIVSLSLRSLHHLATVPTEVVSELQAQARALLARAYEDLGHMYANSGRYTKAMTHAKQGIELFSATKDKLHAAVLQLWLCRLQLRLAVPVSRGNGSGSGDSGGSGFEDSALLRGLSAVSSTEDAACAQVVSTLQRVLKGLESSDSAERDIQCQVQTLLGRIVLRQGLARMARSAHFCMVCGLCEEDSALPSALEILQATEQASVDTVKEATELLLQASAHFREAGSVQLNGVAHACLAAAYFRGQQDARVQRLAHTHCQHALEQLGESGERHSSGVAAATLQLGVRLLQARCLRRSGGKGTASRTSDAGAAATLCEVALQCLRCNAQEEEERRPDVANHRVSAEGCECLAVPQQVLAGEEQVMTYLRQELSDLLLRLLRGNEHQEAPRRELKGLYGALLTAWHMDTGQMQALTALREYLQSIGSC